MTTNLEQFTAQARLRDQIIDGWLPSADVEAQSALVGYLSRRIKSDVLPIRLYAHQEEMDRLDEAIAMEEWDKTWGFQLPPGAEPLTATALEKE